MDVVLFVVPVVFALAGGYAFLFRKLLAGRERQDSDAVWFNEFSVDTYRPMQRLLHQADYGFLESQPGYRASIARELRRERKAICRAYLKQLTSDFNRLLRIARSMMVQSDYDRADLDAALSRLRRRFYWNLILVEASLALPLSLHGGARVGSLVGAVEMISGLVKPEAA